MFADHRFQGFPIVAWTPRFLNIHCAVVPYLLDENLIGETVLEDAPRFSSVAPYSIPTIVRLKRHRESVFIFPHY